MLLNIPFNISPLYLYSALNKYEAVLQKSRCRLRSKYNITLSINILWDESWDVQKKVFMVTAGVNPQDPGDIIHWGRGETWA